MPYVGSPTDSVNPASYMANLAGIPGLCCFHKHGSIVFSLYVQCCVCILLGWLWENWALVLCFSTAEIPMSSVL